MTAPATDTDDTLPMTDEATEMAVQSAMQQPPVEKFQYFDGSNTAVPETDGSEKPQAWYVK